MTGGNWNRSGRRSGGYRKAVIHVPADTTVYRECPICRKIVPPYDESCAGCRTIRRLKSEGKLE